MINLEKAVEIVTTYLRRIEQQALNSPFFKELPDVTVGDKELKGEDPEKVRLEISEVEENDVCWLFHWDSMVYMETQNDSYVLVGNAPLLIDKENGEVHKTGINYPKKYIDDFFDYKSGNTTEYDWEKLIHRHP